MAAWCSAKEIVLGVHSSGGSSYWFDSNWTIGGSAIDGLVPWWLAVNYGAFQECDGTKVRKVVVGAALKRGFLVCTASLLPRKR